MCQNLVDVDWAMHDADVPATAPAHKANPSVNSHISNLPTKRTWYDSTAVHAQYYLPHVHAQTGLAFFLNKKYQT